MEHRGQRAQGRGDQGVVGPDAALVAGEDSGLDEDLEVVGDGRLGQAERLGQVADAGLAAFTCADQGDQP